MAGISVARRFCMNRNITSTTSTIASIKAFTTSSMEVLTKGVESITTTGLRP